MLRTDLLLLPFTLITCTLSAQDVQLTLDGYQALKAAGALPPRFHVVYSTSPGAAHPAKPHAGLPKSDSTACGCWLDADSSWSLLPPADDLGSGEILLPFTFDFFGDAQTSCFINNNGNVSFGQELYTYSPSELPTEGFTMIAPFWADVDTRLDSSGVSGGRVRYKVTPTALYVAWDSVGYYGENNDKRNSFQLTLTDGTDPVVPDGNNVSLCYRDMQWTTGEASCWTDSTCTYGNITYSCDDIDGFGYGFCGFAATVGANRGNAVDHVLLTTTNHPGTDYDGPSGEPDGVSWLDGRHFIFNTAANTNLPPVTGEASLCDTLDLCWAAPAELHASFFTPEPAQELEATWTIDPPLLAAVTETNNGPASTVDLGIQFIPELGDTGTHVITFTATDNGVPPLSQTIQQVIDIGCYNVAVAPIPGVGGSTPSFIAPQPLTGRSVLHMSAALTAEDRVRITDARGRIVRQLSGNGTRELPIMRAELASGTYLLHILRKGTAGEVLRLVVE